MNIKRNFFTPLHTKSSRDYLARMVDSKVECMKVAKKFEKEFWDGDRRFGYGGYRYDGRWVPVAEEIIATYNLTNNSKILDVGCGKAHLLYEISRILPGAHIEGFDVSEYAIANAKEEIKDNLYVYSAEDILDYENKYFDLVLSIGVFQNLTIYNLEKALLEMERVGKSKYVMVESYRNDLEQFNLQCWALTCVSFFSPEEWLWLFEKFGYSGDYELIFFE